MPNGINVEKAATPATDRAEVDGAKAGAYDLSRAEAWDWRQRTGTGRRAAGVLGLQLLDAILIVGCVAMFAGTGIGQEAAREYLPAITAVLLLSLTSLGAYHPGEARRDRRGLLAGISLGVLILGSLTAFPPHLPLSWGFLLGLGLSSFVALSLGRKAVEQVVRQVHLRGLGLRRALLIGNLDEVGTAIQQLRGDQNLDQYLVGHLSPDGDSDPTALGPVGELGRVISESQVQEVIVASELPASVLRQVAACCFEKGIILFIFPTVVASIDCQAKPVRVGSLPLLHLFPSRLRPSSLILKRAFDWAIAALAVVIAAPLMALIALAIKLDTPGPVFFRQERVGRNGRRFRIWKFRSMQTGADTEKEKLTHLNTYGDPRLFKMPDDPRVTRVGRILRRSSLDELPQLFNVLRGEMSLVGPRPPLPSEVAQYEPHHLVRLAVMPGITGPWQVNGRNLITDFEEVVRMERNYIQSWSFWADLKILVRTLPVVISGEGAY